MTSSTPAATRSRRALSLLLAVMTVALSALTIKAWLSGDSCPAHSSRLSRLTSANASPASGSSVL